MFGDLDLDRTIDPTKLSADELVRELQDLTKKLLGYGARAPKELMLFVKNMMFLDGAIARLAPDLDILDEIQQVHTEIAHAPRRAPRRGARDRSADSAAEFDMDAIKAAMGVARCRDADVSRRAGAPRDHPRSASRRSGVGRGVGDTPTDACS